MVEEYQGTQAVVGIVSGHPHHPADDFDALNPCRYTIQSSKYRSRYSNITEVQLFNTLKEYCGYQRGGDLGANEVVLLDDNGDRCEFVFESFCFKFRDKSKPGTPMGYQVLTLGMEKQRITTVVSPGQVNALRKGRVQ